MVELDEKLRRVLAGWSRREAWPHAVIISGSERSGLLEHGLFVAKRLLCERQEACGDCQPCQRVDRHSHIDLHRLCSPATAKAFNLPLTAEAGDRALIRKEEVLELCTALRLRAHEGGWRVVLVLRPEEMNKEAANTLLKTLEEPGEHCLFILVTAQPKALLSTIISRCQQLRLQTRSREELTAYWQQEGVEPRKADVLAALDLRGFGTSPEELLDLRPLALGWLQAVMGGQITQELELSERLSRLGQPEAVLRILRSLVSDLLGLAAGRCEEDLTHRDRLEELRTMTGLDSMAMARVLDRAPGDLNRNLGLVSILSAAARGGILR